ncbi:MAG: hypothetical protein JWN44_6939 [Myxococcales bacterium]|nr:hypothetical protein [Myxococcales bacterium]
MIELGVVGLVVAALVAVPALFAVVPWEITFGLGVGLVALGMLVGVPAGAMYHLWLWRAVKPTGRRWWLHPSGLHGQLGDANRGAVMRWFKLGAVGFVLAIVGCAMVAVGALRS